MPGNRLRDLVPALGVVALVAMFFGLPEAPNLFGALGCTTCASSDPYLPLVGAGYFASVVALALLFPGFPGQLVARGGLVWAVLLTAALTYLKWPHLCAICLVGHTCNVLIWTIWATVPASSGASPVTMLRERLCLTLFAPLAVIALFSSVNLTLMAYGFEVPNVASTGLQPGDEVPQFSTRTSAGRALANTDAAATAGIVLNFVSPDCPYCEEQLPRLNTVAAQLANGPYRIVNVSRELPTELVQRSPAAEWVLDTGGQLRQLFQVSGYPTTFVLGANGKIAQVIPGVPESLESTLLTGLVKP